MFFPEKVVSLPYLQKLPVRAKILNRMNLARRRYLEKLIGHRHNHLIKVITGMRRSGKSYLLFTIFYNHLLKEGVDESHIIRVDLEDRRNKALRNPDALLEYIDGRMKDKEMYYILLDEIQFVPEFEDVLNSYLNISNADVYVTGSNSKFLSKDVITEFRGRGDEIRVFPLSPAEIHEAFPEMDWQQLWELYLHYGGLPLTVLAATESEKAAYLKTLFDETYLKDIKERNKIRHDMEMETLLNIISSSVGSLTNPLKLANSFASMGKSKLSAFTIKQYLDYFADAFLISKAERYDIKGKKYISTPYKYYFSDIGLRNARLNFRQIEETHIMENVIYNELRLRGYGVDVGVVEVRESNANGNSSRKQIEVDFVCNQGSRRYYIQSAFALPTPEKAEQEFRPLRNIPDSFKKIVIVKDDILVRRNEDGIVTMGLKQFLLDEHSLEL